MTHQYATGDVCPSWCNAHVLGEIDDRITEHRHMFGSGVVVWRILESGGRGLHVSQGIDCTDIALADHMSSSDASEQVSVLLDVCRDLYSAGRLLAELGDQLDFVSVSAS